MTESTALSLTTTVTGAVVLVAPLLSVATAVNEYDPATTPPQV
jgi:hypothetical protein